MGTTSTDLDFDPERQQLARAYQREALTLGLAGTGLFVLVAYLAMATGLSIRLEAWAASVTAHPWGIIALYGLVAYATLRGLALPLRVVARRAALRYGLSKLSWSGWIAIWAKSFALGLLLTLLMVQVLYWTIRNFGSSWWLVLWILGILFALVAGLLGPVVLLPMFYKVRTVENAEVVDRLQRLAQGAKVQVVGVYEFRSSPTTERGTAGLAGLGATRRILLSDHILDQYTPDEVEGILAHELGHHVQRDGILYLVLSSGLSLLGLYLASLFVGGTMGVFGVADLARVGTLPLFVLFGIVFYALTSPLTRAISRRREARADALGASLSGKPRSLASALVKLHNQNLADASPPVWMEVLFYTHPAGRRRVRALLSAAAAGEPEPDPA